MDTNEFKNKFEVDRAAKTPRATPRHQPAEYPIAATADGKPFNHSIEYFFFDGEQVRSSNGFRRVDAEYIGNMGMRIVEIKALYSSRSKAIDAAELHCVRAIQKLKDKIRAFEQEKDPKDRTMKFVLMGRE